QRLLIVKGAPEDVLALSVNSETDGSAALPMTDAGRKALTQRFESLGADGFRALGIATKIVPSDQSSAKVGDEADLTFAGFALFLDPPKASAEKAVKA